MLLEDYENNNELYIVNEYGMGFNHESPGHANLYNTENWLGGKDHFVNDNYKEFINRYERRIQNFKNYINNNSVLFIIENTEDDLNKIINIIKLKYPFLNFKILHTRNNVIINHY